MAKDKVNEKEKELTEIMVKHSQSLEKYVDDEVNDMVKERREMLENNEKQFKDIRMVVCNYFEKYDVSLKEI